MTTAAPVPSPRPKSRLTPRRSASDRGPSPKLVGFLQSVRSPACASVLMTTTPAPRMTREDADRLDGLVRQASQRLATEDLPDDGARLISALDDLAVHAAERATGTAIALYAASTGDALVTRAVQLPIAVHDRVVVDPTFATRDLVRALHRTPRHVVLVLSATEARLFEGIGEELRPVTTGRFPLHARPADPDRAHRPASDDRRTRNFLHEVDRDLRAHLAGRPAPVVLVGPERLVMAFRSVSRNLPRLAGAVTGSHLQAPLPELAARIRPVLDAYLHSRQREALDLLDQRTGAGRVASGMAAAWMAARHEQPEFLAVEDSLYLPARTSADGDFLAPADDVEHPDVLDDAVDELIEIVLRRGGWVALVDEGHLAAHDGVALAVKGRRR